CSGINSDRKSNEPREQNGCKRYQYRQEDSTSNKIRHRHLIFEGVAKISLQHAPNPDEVPFYRTFVETIFAAEKFNLRLVNTFALRLQLGHITFEVIPGWKLHDCKNQRACQKKRWYHEANASNDI